VISLGLKDKTDTRAACLSGGMQRKLQVFIVRNASSTCFVVQ
jgi:ABC-type multidrug transport system ATPase subunit